MIFPCEKPRFGATTTATFASQSTFHNGWGPLLGPSTIEEYTHKEVISKTFEGLSKQVEQIDSDNVRELNLKLLYNIINMTSDNPGQLIKGFDQSDHPLIEVLNNIMKSEKSLDNLSNIPGIALIIEQLQKRLNKIKSKNKETIEDNIES